MTKMSFFSSKIKALAFIMLAFCLTLSGCSTLNDNQIGLPKVAFKVFKNQNSGPINNQYNQVFIVAPPRDQLQLTSQIALALKQQGIITEQYESNTFFAPQGTGFFISSNGLLLTCDHVVGQRQTLSVQKGAQEIQFQVLLRDPTLDLALLKTEEPGPWSSISLNLQPEYNLGEEVYALGYPLSALLGTSPRLTQGIVSAEVGFADEKTRFQFSAPIQPGNSGGPILDDQGRLLGIAQSTLDIANAADYTGGAIPQNVNFAVHKNSILDFLKLAQDLNLVTSNDLIEFKQGKSSISGRSHIKNFKSAAQASVLISGPPQTKEDALVIAVDYLPADSQPASSVSNTNAMMFTLTLFDFRTKKPLYRLLEENSLAGSVLIQASLDQIGQFLADPNYPASMEHAILDQASTQAVAATLGGQYLTPQEHAIENSPPH